MIVVDCVELLSCLRIINLVVHRNGAKLQRNLKGNEMLSKYEQMAKQKELIKETFVNFMLIWLQIFDDDFWSAIRSGVKFRRLHLMEIHCGSFVTNEWMMLVSQCRYPWWLWADCVLENARARVRVRVCVRDGEQIHAPKAYQGSQNEFHSHHHNGSLKRISCARCTRHYPRIDATSQRLGFASVPGKRHSSRPLFAGALLFPFIFRSRTMPE